MYEWLSVAYHSFTVDTKWSMYPRGGGSAVSVTFVWDGQYAPDSFDTLPRENNGSGKQKYSAFSY